MPRPWGEWHSYREFNIKNQKAKLKSLIVKPGQKLSYQKHNHRNEHWFVIKGIATIILDDVEHNINTFEHFDIAVNQGGGADLRGDGEHMMKIRRVLPDFLSQTGDARVTLNLKNYPTDSESSSSLGPFTSSTTTDKIDTRARARAIALKVDNTSIKQHWKLGTFRLDIQADGRR